MKKISLVLALVLSVIVSTAQTWTKVNGRWQYQFLRADSTFTPPQDTLASAPIGSVAVKSDVVYFKNAAGSWVSLIGLSTDSSIFSTIYGRDTAIGNVRTQIAGIHKNLYGLIYGRGSWANLNDFDNNGVTSSISGNKILLQPSGSAGTFTQTLDLKQATCLEYWRVLVHYTLKTSPGATSYGLGVGVRSINTHVTSSVLGYTDMTTDATNGGRSFHSVDYPTPVALATSINALSRSLNDQFEMIVERAGNNLTVTTRNLTNNSIVAKTSYDYSTLTGSPLIHNTGKFSLFALGGQVQIDSISVFSKEIKGADLLVAGDSKTVGYFADYASSWINLIRPSFNGIVLHAGGGDRPQDVYARLNEILALEPKQVLLEIGTNESDSTVTKDYIQRINDTLVAHGIRVIHTSFYQTASDAGWRYNYLLRTFPYVIDCYNPLIQPNALNVDGVHPNNYGDTIISASVLNSGDILYGKPYGQVAAGNAGGNFIDNSTSVQPSANFNISGFGQAGSWKTSQSGANAGFHFRNVSSSLPAAESILTPIGAANQSMSFYLEPNGVGAGGTTASVGLFNAPLAAGNFGGGIFQMKDTEFDLYTLSVGSGTLVPFKIFTGSNTQLILNTDGTNSLTGNTYFNNQIGIQTVTPLSTALLHATRNVNNNNYIYLSNVNGGISASAIFKASLSNAQDTTEYAAMGIVGSGYLNARHPIVTAKSAIFEGAGGKTIVSNYNHSDGIVFTTDTTRLERMRIDSVGNVSIEKMDSMASPANMTWRDPVTHKLKLSAPPSLNGQTGAVTITAGTGITTSTLSGDITVAVDVNNSVLPHTIATYFTDVANSGTSETDLYSTTTGANTLSSNGQTLYFDYTVNVTDVTATVALVAYFGGTQIGNTGALTVSSTGAWRVTGSITRATSTTARATVVVDRPGTDSDYINETDLTSQDFTTTNVVKITGQAGGTGGGTGDITAKMGKLYYQP
jgi:hypothetical protein